jgi:hypothetical protein
LKHEVLKLCPTNLDFKVDLFKIFNLILKKLRFNPTTGNREGVLEKIKILLQKLGFFTNT